MKGNPAKRPFLPYEVPFVIGYEPYVILSAQHFVPYDERLRGYGQNKYLNVMWLHHNGSAFHVLPGHFLVEDAHTNSVMFNKTHRNTPVLTVSLRNA